MAGDQTTAGRWLNENFLPVPGNVDTFDDAAAPENDLLSDGVDYRDTYYQETATVLQNVGTPDLGAEEPDAGFFTGTLIGDVLESGAGAYHSSTGGDVMGKVDAISQAGGTARDVADAASIFIQGIKGTTTLAKFDPFNFLGSQLMSWMLEHVEPLRKALDSVSGNPDMVQAYTDSWQAIGEHLTATAEQLATALDSGIGEWAGSAAEAYRANATELAGKIAEQGAVAQVLSDCNTGMKSIVEAVRGVIVEILSSLAGMLAEATALLLISGGTATPALIARALFDIGLASAKVGTLLIELGTALVEVKSLASAAVQVVKGVAEVETAK
ncbi:WXG100 family type VII secretion target [Nocardia rhizosphaerae]|uniref:WXG100 family type VII secretion target n=1 Tax=Nocardia rhizosphaerae TaxID=1691571 RepID=A0ABV8LDF8_9NOCA